MDASDPIQTAAGLTAERLVRPLKIFINYRHEDMPFAASALYRELKARFGKENIFYDGGSLLPGTPFLEEIKSQLERPAGAFVALIGPRWLSTMDAHRRNREDDYVTKEIELGFRNGWTVIPVLLNNTRLPDQSLLPPAIRALPGHQVAQLRQASLDSDIDDLCEVLEEISARQIAEGEASSTAAELDPNSLEPDSAGNSKTTVQEVHSADDEHYQMLVDEADNLVIFLGAGANADDHEGPYRAGSSMLPDDTDLAEYLAVKARLKSGQRELAEVAQYARMIRGEPRMLGWVKQILAVDAEPGPVHTYLARLPRHLEDLGLEKRYQMIVTPKFDVALEQAFLKARR